MATPAAHINPMMEQAFKKYEKDQTDVLAEQAAVAYVAGDLAAQKRIGAGISFSLVNQGAIDYVQQYKTDLVKKGGSFVTVEIAPNKYEKQFKPWLKESNEDVRQSVGAIIEKGIAEGKATGVRQGPTPQSYPKDSIAADLMDYFNMRKSHASLVARTETMNIVNDAGMKRYVDSGIEFVIRLEGGPHECPKCRALAGKVFPINQAPPATLHPQCVGTNAPHPGPATAIM